MLLRLFLLFTVVPAIEMYLLIQIGQRLGAAETVFLIFVTGLVGSYMAKREGFSVMHKLQEDARKGIPPASRLVEGLMVLIGGVLLITPGVLTDVFGLSLIFPITRQIMAPLVQKWATKKFTGQIHIGQTSMNFGGVHPGNAAKKKQEALKPQGGQFDHPVRD